MADKKPLYQPWNEDEFQSSLPVRGMTYIQKWMYKSLLQSAFFCKTSPYLPNDDNILWVLAGCGSLREWQENKAAILPAFEVRTENGLFSHKRIVDDWNRVIAYRKRMKKLGKRSAEAKRTFSGRTTYDQPMEMEKEVECKESKEKDSSLSLEQFADKVL